MAMSLDTVLAPIAVLMSTTTIELYAVVWTVLMHPGSTHASNLIGLHVNTERVLLRSAWKRQQGGRPSDLKTPYAGDLNISSLQGLGRWRVTESSWHSGRTSVGVVGFMSQGRRLLMWHQNEVHMYESVIVELHEMAKWKRTTMDGTRSFTIYHRFFGTPGAVHPPDVATLYLEIDPLGVVYRISFFYTHPTFRRAREVEEAAHILAPAPFGLETSLSHMFMRIAEVSCGRPARKLSICLRN